MPQEIKKIPIVIASILKPVDDTRMLEKLGYSIRKIKDTTITIIGYPSTAKSLPSHYSYFSFVPFQRISIGRLRARFTFLKHVLALKPKLVILTTHELLVPALVAKWIVGCKLIYDVQENYYRNIIHSHTFPAVAKELVALYVRAKEKVVSPAIDHFFSAEVSYKNELTFIQNRYLILENKVSKKIFDQYTSGRKRKEDGNIHLLFSGTLATSTGVFDAIRWTKLLYSINPSIRLTIIGYCALSKTLVSLKDEIKDCPFITLIGGDQLIPHDQVLEEISSSDAGFITYQPNTSTSGSIPTKLFEYLAFRIPILLVPHAPWVTYCEAYQAAILLDEKLTPSELLSRLQGGQFYSKTPTEIYWEDQEASLLTIIQGLLAKN